MQKLNIFFDQDPGIGKGIPIPVSIPAAPITLNTTITIGALAVGNHYLFVRSKDANGKWSLYEPVMFTVDNIVPVQLLELNAQVTHDRKVNITWKTATEMNNAFFTDTTFDTVTFPSRSTCCKR